MEVRELAVPDSYVVELTAHGDPRGRLVEWFRADALAEVTGVPLGIAQANHTVSARGVLRGLHFSLVPPGQGKYVYCPAGAVLDVVVDVRDGSPTFGMHDAVVLDSEQPRAVYLSEGLGHAFLSLTDDSCVTYLLSTPYAPERDRGVHPLDPDLALPWPKDVRVEMSARDSAAPTLGQARAQGLLPTMAACRARHAELLRG